jgi:hypothetical protein
LTDDQHDHAIGHRTVIVTPRQFDLSAISAFVEAWSFDIKPTWRGGFIILQASISDGTDYEYCAVDVRVIGYLAGIPVTLRRAELGRDAGPIQVDFEDFQAYQRIVVQARRRISGGDIAADGVTYAAGAGPTISFGAQGRFLT